MEELKGIEELKGKKQVKPVIVNTEITEDAPVEKTLSDEFRESLNDADKIIFDKLKNVLINTCSLYEHEAFTEENIEDVPDLIRLFSLDLLKFEDDGISLKLRKKIVIDSKKEIIVDTLTFLFERNEARENQFTKFIKIKKSDISAQKDFIKAIIAASLKNIDYEGAKILLSTANLKKVHDKDYDTLLSLYSFFR